MGSMDLSWVLLFAHQYNFPRCCTTVTGAVWEQQIWEIAANVFISFALEQKLKLLLSYTLYHIPEAVYLHVLPKSKLRSRGAEWFALGLSLE